MLIFYSVIIFALGLIVGSFLNVVIFRLRAKEKLIFSRSHCPKCKKKLTVKDLIPVFSFIIQKGKCCYCHKKISWQYPLVELVTGVSFLLIFLKFYNNDLLAISYQLLAYWFFAAILIIIFVYDFKYYLIPDKVIYPALIITLIFQILFSILNTQYSILNIIIGSLIPGLFFLYLVLISKEKWLGAGDIKLGFLCGLMLGYPNILVALFISFIFGALIGIALILSKKKGLKDQVPYGSFLTASTFLTFFIGNQIINWYMGFLGLS